MPISRTVRLAPHDPNWAAFASREGGRIAQACNRTVLIVHHTGSTAIPGIMAKPIVDLVAVVESLPAFDAMGPRLEVLGYSCRGEHGLASRRYCILDDPKSGTRRVHLHCYAVGDPAISRHLRFRDYLRARPDSAEDYSREKIRCAGLHAHDSHAYTICKTAWISEVEAAALRAC